MTVEEVRRTTGDDESKRDNFPVGMRVLAVDDDVTCLKVLEGLLRRCQYHVTTTNQAVKALQMLRENKDKFDLVISDVHMPDMDGFKLLELVGLEMDLPVIMLSGNGDPRLVMKGVTHGACDYLLKPVRIEELRNIWQHVIRRKKPESKDQNNFENQDKSYQGLVEDGQSPAPTGSAEQSGKVNRKRKEQNEDEDDEGDEDANETEESSSQKKPRVVWSVELHRKFVAAVNQLGIDKAVPKKILDLMNVEKLTRENVASHLQKYRIYLKRVTNVASQQLNMVAALSGKDPSYLRMGSLDGFADFHSFSGAGQLANASMTSLPPGGMLGRLNSPAGLGLRGLTASPMLQLAHSQSSSNSINDYGKLQQVVLPGNQPGKLQQVVLPGNQPGNLLQGMPTTLELDHLQRSKSISRIGEFSADSTGFPVRSGFQNRMTISNSNNSFLNATNNSLMLPGSQQQTPSSGTFGNQQLARMNSFSSEPFGGAISSQLLDSGRCNDNWQSGAPLIGNPSNSLAPRDPFSPGDLSSSNLRNDLTAMVPRVGNNPLAVPAQSVVSTTLLDSRGDVPFQAGPINLRHDNSNFANFGSIGNNVPQHMNFAPAQKWEDQKQNFIQDPDLIFSSLNSSALIQGNGGAIGQNTRQNNSVGNRSVGANLTSQSNCATPYLAQHNGVAKTSVEATMKLNEDNFLDQAKSQDGFATSCGSLEDLMSAMIRRDRDELSIMDGDVNCDFPIRTCM